MTISVLPISREKMTDAMPCLIEHDRMKSMLSVELWVGTIDRPARYRCSPSTSTHRTGTDATGALPWAAGLVLAGVGLIGARAWRRRSAQR